MQPLHERCIMSSQPNSRAKENYVNVWLTICNTENKI